MVTKLFAGLFLTLGLALAGPAAAADKAAPGDCCTKKLACCAASKACCAAPKKLGCCDRGLGCCDKPRACCSAAQECCRKGESCCGEAKACCGPTANKTAVKHPAGGGGCCTK